MFKAELYVNYIHLATVEYPSYIDMRLDIQKKSNEIHGYVTDKSNMTILKDEDFKEIAIWKHESDE